MLEALLLWSAMAVVQATEPDADALDAQMTELYDARRYAAAEALAREILDSLREALGPRHLDVATALNNLALLLKVQGDYPAALPLYEEILNIRREALGPRHLEVATSLNNLASLLRAQGDYRAARPLYAECLDIRREALGPRHPKVATALNNLAGLLQAQGDYPAARPLYEESLDIRREALGPRHPDVAASLNNFAMLLRAQAEYSAAQPLLEESLDINRDALGPRHPDVATSMNNLAALLKAQGDYTAARPLYDESLDIWREVLGPRHPSVAHSLNNLASLLQSQGDYTAARSLYDESLDIQREALGPQHPNVAMSLSNLAALLKAQGNYTAALPLYAESLDILRKALGPRHPKVATALNNLASLLQAQGDYTAARPLYAESLDISREALVPRHAELASRLSNLAGLLQAQGDYTAARPLLEESLDIKREAHGPRHPDVALGLNNLATLLQAQGGYSAARPLLEESLDIWREALGQRHPDVALGLNNLAAVLKAQGNYSAARPLYAESLDIKREALGPRHPSVATSLNNLAVLLKAQGDYPAARPLYAESLDIWREALGPRHPKVATALNNLAGLLEVQGEPEEGRGLRDEALDIIEGRLTLLDTLSEREALRFLPTVRPTLDGWLAAFDRPGDAAAAWAHLQRFKGAVAARARAARALSAVEPEVATLAAELDGVRRQRARLTFAESPPEQRLEKAEQLAALSAEQERLERLLLSQSARFRSRADAKEANLATLCAALPDDSALIDILRYSDDGPRYLAFVLRQVDCSVVRVELGPAAALEQATLDWHKILRDPRAPVWRGNKRGQRLTDLLHEPVAAIAGDDPHWLVVLDGPLATVPLAALPTDTGYVIEDRQITYLDRATDVLRRPEATGTGALLVGGVDYDAARSAEGKARSFLAPCNGGGFAPLPGTLAETDQLTDRWLRARKKEPMSRLAHANATESTVAKALEGKALAHIATHGFFATGDCKSALDDGVGYDPMLLSGLVLAGANQPPDPLSPEDGILTASEVATLDLAASDLVVLSACETGLGEISSGQGVLGLRRAFAIAGARTLVMSLWSVSDADTAKLMDGFYSRLLKRRKSLPAAEALREAQLEMLAEQRASGTERPFAWAAFIASGDWR